MKVVIVDDEHYALQGLKMKLECIDGVEIVGMYDDSELFLREFADVKPEVVLLDVEMPKKNGFDVLGEILDMGLSPNVIFVTAQSHYAVQAFEVNALDYVVKPVSVERLTKALSRVKAQPLSIETIETDSIIKISCFNSFSINYRNKEFNTGWKTKKSEELLAYLICEKGRFVQKEKVAEALWPDDNSEKSMANLHAAFYYLKQQEKKMNIKLPVDSKRGTMRIILEETECDMINFDEFYDKANNRKIPEAQRVEYMEKSVVLYKGALLEDRYYSWILSFQQFYEMKYEELLRDLIKYYDNSKSIKKFKYYKDCLLRHIGEE